MKLYTEEHLKLFYQLGKFDGIARRETDVEEEIKNHLPIELPSDEEIQKESNNEYQEQKQSYENSVEMFPIDFANYLEVGFIEGAKWMRDKIRIQGR
jgi:hypothetical protein